MDRDPRQDARDALSPDGRALTVMLENLIAEGAQAIRSIRGQLEAKARSSKGLSGRTLVEWHKAEAMAMSRAKAITAMGKAESASTYEQMLRDLTRDG